VYEKDRQRGSHIVMRQVDHPHRRITVPDHREIATGTQRAIVRQARLTVEEFKQLLWTLGGALVNGQRGLRGLHLATGRDPSAFHSLPVDIAEGAMQVRTVRERHDPRPSGMLLHISPHTTHVRLWPKLGMPSHAVWGKAFSRCEREARKASGERSSAR
jgi:hypothetical protein